MARSVFDAAVLLGVLEGDTPDPNDLQTGRCVPPPGRDYTRLLRPDALKGARIGVPRAFFYEALREPGLPAGGLTSAQTAEMTAVIDTLRAEGAVVIDPADIPSIVTSRLSSNALSWPPCVEAGETRGNDAQCSIVLKYGMKRDFNAWLRTLGGAAPVSSLRSLREWNRQHAGAGAMRFGQSALDISDDIDLRGTARATRRTVRGTWNWAAEPVSMLRSNSTTWTRCCFQAPAARGSRRRRGIPPSWFPLVLFPRPPVMAAERRLE
jgi:amidase